MLEAIFLIFLCQLVGEVAARVLGVPVPGPVIGMALLFACLQLRRRLRPEAAPASEIPIGVAGTFLLAHLSLLFVPAGVGITSQLPTLAQHGVGLIVALVVSTFLSLVVTALVFSLLSKRFNPEKTQ